MIYCNECGQKHPHHKPDCSQVGGTGATAKNTYSERDNTPIDKGPEVITTEAVINVSGTAFDVVDATVNTTDDTSSSDTLSDSTGE